LEDIQPDDQVLFVVRGIRNMKTTLKTTLNYSIKQKKFSIEKLKTFVFIVAG